MPDEDEKNPPETEEGTDGKGDKPKLVDLSSGDYVSIKKYNKAIADLEEAKQAMVAQEQQLRAEFEAEKSAILEAHQQAMLQREVLHQIHECHAHDETIVATLIDQASLTVDDNGQVQGLEEQLEAIKKEKPFLFEAADATETTSEPTTININFEANQGSDDNDDALLDALKKKGMI